MHMKLRRSGALTFQSCIPSPCGMSCKFYTKIERQICNFTRNNANFIIFKLSETTGYGLIDQKLFTEILSRVCAIHSIFLQTENRYVV